MDSVSFKANAHLLKLLGDELIGDDRLAIFELVKNAYDADATHVDVILELELENPRIIVRDYSGHGMDKNILTTKWMEIGTDSKREKNRIRSHKFNRMPLGEKGVGRLAVHKLGNDLVINTRASGSPEYKIVINWDALIEKADYIEDTKVSMQELDKPEFFDGEDTGTRIEVKNLNNKNWTRRDIRRLKRLLTSLVSPFDESSGFSVNLEVPGREKEISDVLDVEDVINLAIWKYTFSIDEDGKFSYHYEFTPPSLFHDLKSKEVTKKNVSLEMIPPDKSESVSRDPRVKEALLLKDIDMNGIGPISGVFYIYLRDRKVLNALGAFQDIRNYLDEQTGVRIYRDGIRVFNYGEPNDDWLGLNIGRINSPGRKVGTDMVLARINLNLEKSYNLKEKTNREGFDDNDDYRRLKWIVNSAIDRFYQTHYNDREDIASYIKEGKKKSKPDLDSRFSENMISLQKSIKKHGLEKEVGGKVKQIENDFKQMREVTLSTGLAGMNLAVIFHEVERGVDDLNSSIKNNEKYEVLLQRSDHLSKLLEGFAPLLRKNEKKSFGVKKLVKRVIDLSEHRFKHHNVVVSCPLLTGESQDFKVYAPFGLLQAALSNVIDNSIHWTRLKAEGENSSYQAAIRVLTLTDWFKEGPALVVVDNGPGFDLLPEEAVQPFKTTRPAGMGVGLYYVDKVMEAIGGRLLITSCDDLDMPSPYSGAAVVFIFKGEK